MISSYTSSRNCNYVNIRMILLAPSRSMTPGSLSLWHCPMKTLNPTTQSLGTTGGVTGRRQNPFEPYASTPPASGSCSHQPLANGEPAHLITLTSERLASCVGTRQPPFAPPAIHVSISDSVGGGPGPGGPGGAGGGPGGGGPSMQTGPMKPLCAAMKAPLVVQFWYGPAVTHAVRYNRPCTT